MSNIAVLETIDSSLRAITGQDIPFGGKLILGIGDFRQVGPVIPGAGTIETYEASIKSSSLWPSFQVLPLHTALRYGNDTELCSFIDSVGDGWDMPEVSLPMFSQINTLEEAADVLYPDELLSDWQACLQRAFISPRNILVDEFNHTILDRLPGEESE